MRKISFNEPNTASWKKWRARCVKETAKAGNDIAKGLRPTITDLYKGQKAFYMSMTDGFFGKCAYCEQNVASNQHGDIDHYRPKNRPTDMNWSPVRVRENGKLVPHPGYYWLAYHWENLLVTCQLCNQVPKGRPYGKGDRFPVSGSYASRPGKEITEKPLLLNPCVDDPAQHLEIDQTGSFTAKTVRGDATITMLGLNLRDLPIYRSKIFADIEDKLCTIILRRRVMGHAWAQKEIAGLASDNLDYAGSAKIALAAARKGILSILPN